MFRKAPGGAFGNATGSRVGCPQLIRPVTGPRALRRHMLHHNLAQLRINYM